ARPAEPPRNVAAGPLRTGRGGGFPPAGRPPPLVPPAPPLVAPLMTKFCKLSCQSSVTCCPACGKLSTVNSPLAPVKNSVPKLATVICTSANFVPSAQALTVWGPASRRLQLNKRPKPLLTSPPQAVRVSARPVPWPA